MDRQAFKVWAEKWLPVVNGSVQLALCKPAFALLGFVFVVIVLCFVLMFTRKKDLLKRESLWH